ncbi:MAG: PTS sugar transporter subunit IIA [Lentisphaeraceae bacterium]|nr:PTS sugar transporter subunit IIA [Lentisphaeraceae bacterium]
MLSADMTMAQILLIGALIMTAFVSGKIFRKIGLGETAGQVVGGILIGPSFLKFIDYLLNRFEDGLPFFGKADASMVQLHENALSSLLFYLPVYMGVVLFTITEECHADRIKELGKQSLITSITHTLITFFLVFGGLYYFADLPAFVAAILAAVASSSSPASVLISMTHRQVEGRMKTIWAQSTTIDTITELILFVIILIVFSAQTQFAEPDFKGFVRFAGVTLAIGVGTFFLIKSAVQNRLICDEFSEKTSNKKLVDLLSSDSIPTVTVLFIVWAAVCMNVGTAMVFKVPFTIAIIVTGLLVSNYHSQYIFDSLKVPDLMRFSHLFFFALIGSRFDFAIFSDFSNLKLIGIYIVLRTIGKLFGTWLACLIIDREKRLQKFLPYLFLPNMGATGISLLVMGTYVSKSLTDSIAAIIPAMLLFEVAGASLVNQVLKKWKKIISDERTEKIEKGEAPVPVESVELISFEKILQDRIIVDIDVRSKEDAMKMMCAELLKHGNISELQNILSLVLEREKLCSTGMGDEVALPHCRTSDVDYPMVVCAFVKEGDSIEWDSPDGQGVRFIFLLVSPTNDPNMHIEAMKTITTRILQPGFLKDLYESAKSDESDETTS